MGLITKTLPGIPGILRAANLNQHRKGKSKENSGVTQIGNVNDSIISSVKMCNFPFSCTPLSAII